MAPTCATAWPATSPGLPGPNSAQVLDALLRDQRLVGQMIIGPPGRSLIGAVGANPFEERLRSVMDHRGDSAASPAPFAAE